MKYDITTEKSQVKFTFSLTPAEWDTAVNRAYEAERANYNIQGFRKGKAPRKMIEGIYGASVFFDEAFNIIIRESYSLALDEHPEVFPVDRPNVDIEKFDDSGVVLCATVTVKPELTLGQYQGLSIPEADFEVTDQAVDAEIQRARERLMREVEVTDRACANGDTCVIDFSGSIDGVKFEGGTAEGQQIELGAGRFIPGFEEQVVGMEIGSERDITVKFPDDYGATELAGQTAVFAIKLHSISTKIYPELNDEFAAEVSRFETFVEYKADLERMLIENAKRRARAQNENNLLDAVTANSTVDIPDAMIETQLDYFLGDMEHRLSHQGLRLEDYFRYVGQTIEDYRKMRRDDAVKAIRMRMTAEAIVAAEGIAVTDEDVAAKFAAMAQEQGVSVEQLREDMCDHDLEHLDSEILTDKLIAWLTAHNSFVPASASAEQSAPKPKKSPATRAKTTPANAEQSAPKPKRAPRTPKKS